MANFTVPSVEYVREIIETEVDDAVIEGCIASAAVAVESSIPYTAIRNDLALEIQRWLAAHFVSERTPNSRIIEEKIGESGIKYNSSSSVIGASGKIERFSTTFYGRTAIDLDPTGALRGVSGRPRRQRLCSV